MFQAASQAPSTGLGGGFQYGAAAAGGNPFGTGQAAGGFQSGIGGKPGGFQGFGTAGSGVSFGSGQAAAAQDDPYNIPIDLTKVKRTEKPTKTFEDKTESEKKQAFSKLGGGSTKGIMKKPGQAKKG